MTATKGQVIYLHQRDPQAALERLNRITGLRFSDWPQSLAVTSMPVEQAKASQIAMQPDSAGLCEPAGMLSS
ncbi:hypothetical protein SAMN05216206_0041 [Pseudomonas guineae]|uniref:Uncharacterized protein n=1 Tax=Pseudomonas guineae TaxID=425504 RepID=A0A1I3CEY5_9PSED|nr:hypothetical protein [Pseudomonas guineae]SFH72983.1 hypothetical protein SAMN05216206_0041 [Pseudomonas guineae]